MMRYRSIAINALIFIAAFSLAQLTRGIDFETAIGYVVQLWCFLIGAAVSLAVLCVGGLLIWRALMIGGDKVAHRLSSETFEENLERITR